MQLPGQEAEGERQAAAEPGDLSDRCLASAQVRPASQPHEQLSGLVRRERIDADRPHVFKRGQMPATGNQDQAAGGAGQ